MAIDNTRYEFSPITRRPAFRWPHGERLAVWVCYNIEHFKIDVPATSVASGLAQLKPDVINYAWRDYGLRVGIWRNIEAMDRLGLPGSVTLNAEVCQHEPAVVEEMARRNWCFLGHGLTNSQLLSGLPEAEERKVITETVTMIEKATGKRPIGWLGPALAETFATPELLVEARVKYVCDWVCDDQPFLMKVKNGRLISVPYSMHINDIPLVLEQRVLGDAFGQAICDQFDVLYREGAIIPRTMAIAVHPFLVGIPHLSKHFHRALEYIAGHKDVWFCTGDDIANWYESQYCR
jgi:peptidoglycan/xylan/chitin deacetylase (PgdA/CDA1 family)